MSILTKIKQCCKVAKPSITKGARHAMAACKAVGKACMAACRACKPVWRRAAVSCRKAWQHVGQPLWHYVGRPVWRYFLRPVGKGIYTFFKWIALALWFLVWPLRFLYRVFLRKRIRRLRRKWASAPPINRIDRYITGNFIGTYVFSILLIILVVIVFDYNEKIDKLSIAHNEMQVSWGRIFRDYYLTIIPYFINMFSALFVFISVIFFTTKLADRSEIIAMRASGMSFKRLLRPYFLSAAIIAIANLTLGSFIIPQSNKVRTKFENKYIKKDNKTQDYNLQLQVDTGVIAFFSEFNSENKSGTGFSLDRFQNKKLVSHLTALRIQYDTIAESRYHWHLYNYRIRHMRGMKESIISGMELDTIISIEPKDLLYTNKQQETMTTPELYEYIEKQRTRGSANLSSFEVEFHQRFASAFAAFILTMIGVSLSCEKRKGGMGFALGIGLILSFGYILFQTVTATFATNGSFPPMLAVWLPNILFSFIAFYLYRKTPK